MAGKDPLYEMESFWLGRRLMSGPFRTATDGTLVLAEDGGVQHVDAQIFAASDREVALRKKYPELDRRWIEIEDELLRRRPGAIHRGRRTYYDFTNEPDLAARWTELLDDAATRYAGTAEEPQPIPFEHLRKVSERFVAALALRDPEGVAKARYDGAGTLSLLADHPDLAEQYSKELHAPPARPSSPAAPAQGPDDPPPMERHRTISLQELPWNNPPPQKGLSGPQLRDYWMWALSVRAARLKQLEDPVEDPNSSSYGKWRRERWTQIRMLEAILDLLHGIVAPDAPYLCGEGCNHLGVGLDPEGAKRFLDSLDAFRATTDYESEENYTAEYSRNEMARQLSATQ